MSITLPNSDFNLLGTVSSLVKIKQAFLFLKPTQNLSLTITSSLVIFQFIFASEAIC